MVIAGFVSAAVGVAVCLRSVVYANKAAFTLSLREANRSAKSAGEIMLIGMQLLVLAITLITSGCKIKQ